MKRKSIDVLRAQIFKLKNKGLKARTITNRMNEFNGQNDQISFVV
jgi:HKD family nuclease